MKISVIIPAFNEERYLPKLLECLRRQTFRDFEVIVADNQSTDRTAEIAQRFKAKVVKGGLPAAGRNNGAKTAKGEFLFFLDADVKLPRDFLQKAYDEMERRYLDLATCEVRPLSNLKVDKVLHDIINLSVKISQFSKPIAMGCCIFVTKRLFQRVHGFDESIKLVEDYEFVQRAARYRHLRVLESTRVTLSMRRFRKEGRIRLVQKYLRAGLYRLFKGEIREDIIEYEFGNFESRKEDKMLEKELHKIKKKYKEIVAKYRNKKAGKES